MRSKKSWMIAGFMAVIALVLAVVLLLSPQTTVTVMDANEVKDTPYAERYQELQTQQSEPNWSAFGDLWVIERDPILGKTQSTLVIPCVSFDPCDIGTAGSFEWIAYFTLLSDDPIAVKDVSARFTGDSNTYLYVPENFPDEHLPEIRQDEHRYSARISACTVDSEIEPHQDCSAQVSWTALFSLPHGRTFFRVEIDHESLYRNNV